MVTTITRLRQDTPGWLRVLASLLPLWLFSLAVMAEGFPDPPLGVIAAQAVFYAGLALAVGLILLRWLPVELILVSMLPFLLMILFDEISTSYKTPFILVNALVLTAGVLLYQLSQRRWLGVVLLLLAVALALVLAGQAIDNYWQLHSQVLSSLGVDECFVDAYGCPQFTGQETPWYLLFFHP